MYIIISKKSRNINNIKKYKKLKIRYIKNNRITFNNIQSH